MSKHDGGTRHHEIVLILALTLVIGALLSFLWWVASPILGEFYAWVRTIESGGLWLFTGWGDYFWSHPNGQKFSFTSIYESSVAFNVAFALMVIFIGLAAHSKVSEKHIRAAIQHKKDKGIGYKELMKLQAPNWPANQFFLDHPIAEEYSVSTGPARMPLTALELLMECDAIRGIHVGDTLDNPNAKHGWDIDEERLTARLIRDFGPHNPFAVTQNFPMRNADAIEKAVNELPWHVVSILYACVARLYALDTMATKDFEKALVDVDDYLKDIWRELNRGKAKMGSCLVLGFHDENDRRLRHEKAKALNKKKEIKVWTLKEYLDEPIQDKDAGTAVARAELFPTTKKARDELIRILTEHFSVSEDRLVPVRDTKGRLKRFGALDDLEKVTYEQIRIKQETCIIETIFPRLKCSGYQFGMLGALLHETRAGGTLPPAVFRWMRFYDYPLWSYLRVVGMNTPTPEVAGMFDHTQTEFKAGIALTQPYLTSSPEGVRVEASKYITDSMRQKYAQVQTRQLAREKTKSTMRQRNMQDLLKSTLKEAQKNEERALNEGSK